MSTPVTLAIDTARERLQLALVLSNGAIETEILDIAKGHAEIIFGAIGTLLDRCGLTYQSLNRIAVSTGPGSFTGLRIGLSTARGLGLALDIPVLGIPSLLALSLSHAGPSELIVDAKRGEAYRQSFSAPGKPRDKAELVDLKQILQVAARTTPDDPMIDIGLMAGFAARVRPKDFPPDPTYIRAADAKPQAGFGVARR
ncbi:MAG: tRNA (adenosine(37)-N6)-threonylcarbamoyltransferase complex dimerization subunit type 1 TsaB [Pelagibacterium sp.]|uniref:tRNA (adenosine(37)-N6)-threonylcarbamoyltransferase complex dimerization subunit type 1 TsaB n=1 Tax=Pelagibacterium sp. TaxID=1967288 RepID=UPI0032F05461